MIEELLKEGYENRISRKRLMRETGLNERDLYQQISKEREQGALILSTKGPGGGYWLPGSLEETKAFYRSTRKEAVSLLHILKPFRNEIKRRESETAPDNEESAPNNEETDTGE